MVEMKEFTAKFLNESNINTFRKQTVLNTNTMNLAEAA